MTQYILYHKVNDSTDCPDGIAAAWVAAKAYPRAKVVGAIYQHECPIKPKKNDSVVLVDFSYAPEFVLGWAEKGVDVTLIDHHLSAELDYSQTLVDKLTDHVQNKLTIRFNSQECGATLAWKHFFPDKTPPSFLKYIRLRDLWLDCNLFADPLPNTLIVHQYITEEKLKRPAFELFDELELFTEDILLKQASSAVASLKERIQTIETLCAGFTYQTVAGYNNIPAVTLDSKTSYLASDVGAYLYKHHPEALFVACKTPKGWSLRSDKHGNNTDVSVIAKAMGGGGHRNAAGYAE